MDQALRWATRDFSSVLIPHHSVELESTYGPELIRLMTVATLPLHRTRGANNGPSGSQEKSHLHPRRRWRILAWTPSRSVGAFLDEFGDPAAYSRKSSL